MAKNHYEKDPSEKDKSKSKKFLSPDEDLELLTGYGDLYIKQLFIIKIILPGGIFMIMALLVAYLKHLDYAISLLVGLILSCMFSLIVTFLIKQSHKYILTSRRLIVKHGLFHMRVTSVLYDKITHIEIDQTFLDKILFHHGTIILNTAGGEKDILRLEYVEAPVEFKSVLERLIHEERRYLVREAGDVGLSGIVYDE